MISLWSSLHLTTGHRVGVISSSVNCPFGTVDLVSLVSYQEISTGIDGPDSGERVTAEPRRRKHPIALQVRNPKSACRNKSETLHEMKGSARVDGIFLLGSKALYTFQSWWDMDYN